MTDPILCETTSCGQAYAIFTMRWPGSPPLRICLACGARAAEIAAVMGFVLAIEKIEGASIYGDQQVRPSTSQLLEIE